MAYKKQSEGKHRTAAGAIICSARGWCCHIGGFASEYVANALILNMYDPFFLQGFITTSLKEETGFPKALLF